MFIKQKKICSDLVVVVEDADAQVAVSRCRSKVFIKIFFRFQDFVSRCVARVLFLDFFAMLPICLEETKTCLRCTLENAKNAPVCI